MDDKYFCDYLEKQIWEIHAQIRGIVGVIALDQYDEDRGAVLTAGEVLAKSVMESLKQLRRYSFDKIQHQKNVQTLMDDKTRLDKNTR